MNIVICGGGTGGHLTPGFSIYELCLSRKHHVKMIVAEKDKQIMPKNYHFNTLEIKAPVNLARKIFFIFYFISSLFKSMGFLKSHNTDLVIGMGGFVSFPPLVAAKLMRIPIFLCEQNSIPGKVNKIMYPYAKRSYATFRKTLKYMPKANVFGNPVRKEFYVMTRELGREQLGIDKNKKVLLVMGGSQGAKKLNEIFLSAFKNINKKIENLRVYWLCGKTWFEKIEAEIKKRKYENIFLHAFYKDMASLLYASDFAISRAGSSSISEFMITKLPSILVPFPHAAENHQYSNAKEVLERDGCYLVEESVLNDEILTQIVVGVFSHEEKLSRMKKSIENMMIEHSEILILNDVENTMAKLNSKK